MLAGALHQVLRRQPSRVRRSFRSQRDRAAEDHASANQPRRGDDRLRGDEVRGADLVLRAPASPVVQPVGHGSLSSRAVASDRRSRSLQMQDSSGAVLLSASDLSNFLSCRHRTALDFARLRGLVDPAPHSDPVSDRLRELGYAHEQRVCRRRSGAAETWSICAATWTPIPARGRRCRTAPRRSSRRRSRSRVARLRRHAAACRAGELSRRVVVRGLRHQAGAGDARRDDPAARRLLRARRAHVQGRTPERFHVVTPDPVTPLHSFRFDDFAAYYRLMRARLLQALARGPEALLARVSIRSRSSTAMSAAGGSGATPSAAGTITCPSLQSLATAAVRADVAGRSTRWRASAKRRCRCRFGRRADPRTVRAGPRTGASAGRAAHAAAAGLRAARPSRPARAVPPARAERRAMCSSTSKAIRSRVKAAASICSASWLHAEWLTTRCAGRGRRAGT